MLGVIASNYTLLHHYQLKKYGRTNSICNLNQYFSCDKVASTQFSELLGIPLGAFGLAYFGSLICLLLFFKSQFRKNYFLYAITGVLVSAILFSISFFKIHAMCISCMSIYLLTVIQFLIYLTVRKLDQAAFLNWPAAKGMAVAAALTIGILIGYKIAEGPYKNFLFDPRNAIRVENFIIRLGYRKKANLPIQLGEEKGLPSDIWIGNKSAKITVVEFIDHMCPSCHDFAPIMEQFIQEYQGRVLVVLKQFPTEPNCNRYVERGGHEGACASAQLALCAWKKNRYWEFQKTLFSEVKTLQKKDPSQIGPPSPAYITSAQKFGLTEKEILDCLHDSVQMEKIHQDIELAHRMRIAGTPLVYVNGYQFRDTEAYEYLKYQVDLLLKQLPQ